MAALPFLLSRLVNAKLAASRARPPARPPWVEKLLLATTKTEEEEEEELPAESPQCPAWLLQAARQSLTDVQPSVSEPMEEEEESPHLSYKTLQSRDGEINLLNPASEVVPSSRHLCAERFLAVESRQSQLSVG